MLLKLVSKIEKEGTFLNSLYKTNIILRPKLDQKEERKRKYRKTEIGYSPTSLMNIDIINHNKMLAKQIEECITKIIHHDHLASSQRCREVQHTKAISIIYHINALKDTDHITIS